MEKEIRIKNVNEDVHKDLKLIAKNFGVTLQHFLKIELTKIRNNNSSYLRRNSID